ncbi:arginine decarboxylase [Desulfovibrio sp. X2]|uniref:biosynthetic arginine decarboxylase n=1 Tax=Desulfovibrio sp. X2 TaxID=941449 RepID=UPI00035893B4|nr:biosynthetic arginine decarboxylase [Desulfovibrio sp. X2]EPR44697.1 arginine decarboxylase [Desulfovibrio sp. X2]
MVKKDALERWTVEQSAELYNIRNWGAGYFDVARDGHVVITPFLDNKKVRVSIPKIIKGLRERGLDMPVLLRVENILDSQISLLHESFRTAMDRLEYKNVFRGVYPIKVNQQEQVVEEITRYGGKYHHGLEAGSKAELIAALSMLRDPEACLICNGYKDEEFIDLGLYARKMGYNIFFVLEMPSELELILERSEALGIEPLLGARMKLAAKAGGHWTESGGDRSIFGLDTAQLVQVVDRLKAGDKLHCLRLLHYHLGSQIPNIRDIRTAVYEACRVYAGLVDEGATMGYLDLGGGLAVDYDGSHTNYSNSRNYTLDEYCADVVEAVMQTLDERGVDHPVIITESGRALVAYYSVLLFNILDTARFEALPLPPALPEDTPTIIENLYEAAKSMSVRNVQESLNDAIYYRDETRALFRHGHITLRQRALAENIFWHMVIQAALHLKQLKQVPPELEDLEDSLSDVYYANMSVFQSVPDSWAIGHIFPIMPVHRLDEMPTRRAILADITCDCDGKIDRFIDQHAVAKALPVHELKDSEEYYLGVFLVGAYQETLGDLHNLMGDTNVVSLRIHEDGSFDFVREIEGDAVGDVLSYVEFNPKKLSSKFRETAEKAVREGLISARERREIMRAFEDGMRGYTYFER